MSDSPQPPGWYYAQGDPPDTQRYWDGSQWQGGPQPVPAAGQAGPGMVGAGGGMAMDLASPLNRFLARLVDFFVLLIPMIIISVVFGVGFGGVGGDASFAASLGAGVLTTLIALGYEFFFLSQKEGQTIGKKVANVRVVKEDGSALDQNTTIMRLIIPLLAGIIPILGAFISLINFLGIIILIFVDEKKQVPHDKVAKTIVVNA